MDRWTHLMTAFLASELALTVSHMMRAGGIAWEHRDPFDRMLVAQAQLEDLTLVTSDRRLLAYDGVRTAAWL
jgi:PIN domain nuclease of toxin-antitoxin system